MDGCEILHQLRDGLSMIIPLIIYIYLFIHIYRLLTIVLVVYWISQPSSPVGTRLCQPRDPKFGKTLEGVQLICQWLVWH
jgi:hypothetical protein